MKRLIHNFAVVLFAALLGGTVTANAAAPAPLTSLRAVHALSNEEAALGPTVAFEASVTYYRKGNVDMFVQDKGEAIYLETQPNANLTTGDRVLVHGKARPSFRPEIASDSVTFLRHGTAPTPILANFKQLIATELDCKRVTVHAIVRSADIISDAGLKDLYLHLLMDGGVIDAQVTDLGAGDLTQLLDSEVEITGAVAGKFDSKNQMTGILLEVPKISDVKLLHRAETALTSLPLTPMDEILKGYNIQDRTQRIRVRGTITYYHPGTAIVVQSGSKSLWVSTLYEKPLRIGDVADITGFPDVKNGSLILTNGDIQDTYLRAPVVPRNLTPAELALGGHASDLVSVEGKVLMSIREAVQDEYVLVSDGHLFSAIYRHPERGLDLPTPPMKEIKENSIVRMTGICMLDNGDKFQGQVAFNILLRSSNDVAVVARPSLLNVANLSILVGWLLLIVFGVGTRGWLIERRVRRQTASLAKVEEWRRRILEDINASRPLTEILEQIYELASFRLSGALCWCELSDGARVGNCPPRFAELRVVQIQIAARSGPSHGMISAAFDPSSKPRAVELEALSMAAELTTLAIETRRLYTDLLRRSEFDQLTDIHNRFSLDKHLDALIDDARQRGGVFGLIYVDLDKFKQVNDLYGHQIGDLYLQEVAFRMKLQIRPTDILARLGGDEFAALVTHVRTHADVQEIALRIQRSFADPFEIENLLLHGSASMGVALYPDDGVTKDRLLNAADADMYAVKRIRRQDAATFARD